jgi:hypothetical protein
MGPSWPVIGWPLPFTRVCSKRSGALIPAGTWLSSPPKRLGRFWACPFSFSMSTNVACRGWSGRDLPRIGESSCSSAVRVCHHGMDRNNIAVCIYGPGSNPSGGVIFRTRLDLGALGPTQSLVQWVRTGSFSGVKRLGRGVDHRPPSSAEV